MPDLDPACDHADLEAKKRLNLAEAVRAACIEAAFRSYEDAKISGLCHEGAWECAVSALREVDLQRIAASSDTQRNIAADERHPEARYHDGRL